jgi:hypothetical protein
MVGQSLVRVVAALGACALVAASLPLPAVAGGVAQPVRPTAPTDAVSGTVDLGHYAVNGTVRAAVIDDATGNTYIGGDFTRIGQRTGGTAAVDPPDVGDGAARAGSPEVLGDVTAVFSDDRPGDPGFLLVGRLSAINGTSVRQDVPVYRIHLVAGTWVRDTGWALSGDCSATGIRFPLDMPWIANDAYLIGGTIAGLTKTANATGIVLVNRASGVMSGLGPSACSGAGLLPSIPDLPLLAGCGNLANCYALVGGLAWDATSRRLLVEYGYVIGGQSSAVIADGLAAYDLAAGGGRTWTRSLQQGDMSASRQASVRSVGALPGAFLVNGMFALDASTAESAISRRIVVDAATGVIRERWGLLGKQDPGDGHLVGAGSACTNRDALPTAPLARVGDDLLGWVDDPSALCRYGLDADALTATRVGTVSVTWANDRLEPSVPYAAPTGTTYLLGSDAAVNLDTGAMATWNPDPAMAAGAGDPSVAVAGGAVIVGGDFRFVRGLAMPALAALGPSLAPLAGFASPMAAPEPNGGVRALAFSAGQLVAGSTDGTLAGIDLASGAFTWLPGDGPLLHVYTIATTPRGDLWVGGMGSDAAPTASLRHYSSLATGGSVLPAPALTCLDAPSINGGPAGPACAGSWAGWTAVTGLLADADGRVTIGGQFGSIGGVPRRGLARLEADGTVSGWNPDLLGSLPIPSDGGLDSLQPMSMALLADNLVVGGMFRWVVPNPAGAFWMQEASPILVFSASSGALLRPTDTTRSNWIDVGGWWPYGYAMAPTDGGLAVALGEAGMAVLDATTFDVDTTASAPYLNPNWVTPVSGNAIYTLALRARSGAATSAGTTGMSAGTTGMSAGTTGAAALASGPAPLVIAGTIPLWRNRLAGNVLRTTVASDTTPPTVLDVKSAPRSGAIVGTSTTPVTVSWVAADPHGSGVASYDVAWSVAGGPWSTVASATTVRRFNAVLRPGRDYRFRVRARDNAGNLGRWTAGPTINTRIVQQTASSVRFSSGWRLSSAPAYLGGSARSRGAAGASVTLTFTGRGIGLVATRAPLRGKAKVYVNGRYVRTIDLRATPATYRAVAWSIAWTTSATRTVRVVVAGTPGRPRIDVDAFVIVR